MKKLLIGAILVIGGYLGYQKLTGPHIAAPQINQSSRPPSNVSYKDGQYTGPVTDAYYGNVQVQATVSGGKITDVQFLQYPSDRSTSRQINSQAMPYLKQEVIASQNANVNIISGATQTSGAFVQSLQAALQQAQG